MILKVRRSFILIQAMALFLTCSSERPVVPQCRCECQGDPNCDEQFDQADVDMAVDRAFKSGSPLPDRSTSCPYESADVDCSGTVDVFDIVHIVDVVRRGANPMEEFCDPCGP